MLVIQTHKIDYDWEDDVPDWGLLAGLLDDPSYRSAVASSRLTGGLGGYDAILRRLLEIKEVVLDYRLRTGERNPHLYSSYSPFYRVSPVVVSLTPDTGRIWQGEYLIQGSPSYFLHPSEHRALKCARYAIGRLRAGKFTHLPKRGEHGNFWGEVDNGVARFILHRLVKVLKINPDGIYETQTRGVGG